MVASTSSITSAPITFSGLASGVDTDSIVQKLIAADQTPITNLQNAETDAKNKLAAYSQINDLLNTLQDSVDAMNLQSEVRTTTASVASGSPFSATSSNAYTGSYNISVSQLAQVQKDVSDGFSSSSDAVLGTGTVTVNGQVITVDSSNDSLQGLMSAINDVSETTGVTASIINDGSGTDAYHMVLTGQDASTSFTVSSSLVDSGSNPISFTTTTVQTAQQAKLTVDGLDVVSNSNTVTGVITGVTLNLNAVSAVSDSGPPVQYATSQLSIVSDTATLEKNINTFVTSYNAIMSWINKGYTEAVSGSTSTTSGSSTTSTSSTNGTDLTDAQLSEMLVGDSTVNGIKRTLQTILSGSVSTSKASGTLNNLSQVGISTNQDGTLSVNTATLESALQDNFSGVTNLLAGDGTSTGLMEQFNSYLLDQTSITKGMYAQKQTATQDKLDNLDNQISQKTAALNQEEATLKARFTAMETLVSSLNSQSSFLTQWINSYTATTSSSSKS
jgi:flagellar hook-associated protein 2